MSNETVIFHVSEDYLAHHGIPGQKWGKRNGPPYPLGSQGETKSHRSAEEKKLSKNRSISSEKSTRTSDGKKAHITNKGIEYYDKKLKNQKVTEEFKLYDNEIASEFVSGYWGVDQSQYSSGLVANYDKGFREMFLDRTETMDNGRTVDVYASSTSLFENDYNNMLQKNDGQEAHSETSDFTRTVNPDWGVVNGTTQNCAKCTAATALQWKGVKLAVAGRQVWPSRSDAMEKWFDNPERKDYHYDEVA